MSCIPTPTRTEFTTIASTSTLTTLTDSVTTRAPAVTTIVTQSCSDRVLGPGSTTCIEQAVTEVSTIQGGPITVQVPIVIVFQITQASPTRTLFAPCTNTGGGQPGLTSQLSSSDSSSSLPISESLITTTVTPAATVIVGELTTTLPDGSIEVDTATFTSSFSPIPVVIPAVPLSSSPPQVSTSSSPSTSSIVGPVIGGALGGFFGLIGIVLLIWWLWKKRRNYLPASLVSEKLPRHSDPRLPQGYVVEPQRYEYGQVGSAASHMSHGSPPSLYARSSQSHSHSHAHSISAAQPSLAGASSQWLALRQNSSPTPPMFAPTAISPAGPSSANLHSSSGSSFPGYILQNPPPSSFPARAAARSGYGSGTDDEQSSEGHGSITFVTPRPRSRSSRRHSPNVERRNSRPHSSERRATTIPTFERTGPPPHSRKSFSGAIEIERPVRPAVLRRRSTDATPIYEEPRSPLFVVNHTEEPSGSEAENETPSPP